MPADPLPDDRRHALFLSLYARHQRAVSAYIAGMLTSWADVDEVLQETSLLLWKYFDRFQEGTNFPAWACAYAHRVALQHRRKLGRDKLVFGAAFETAALAALDYVEQLDGRRDAMVGCLDKLPDADRSLLQECYSQRGSVAPVADRLGRSAKSVYKALARIRLNVAGCVERTLRAEGGVA